ncbi:MAG: hypothetical protein C4293_21280 [Nitrospiraceae bacterium]
MLGIARPTLDQPVFLARAIRLWEFSTCWILPEMGEDRVTDTLHSNGIAGRSAAWSAPETLEACQVTAPDDNQSLGIRGAQSTA